MFLLYDLTLLLAAFLLVPRYLLRVLRRGTWRRGLGERFGKISPAKLDAIAGKNVIWVHAVSVGEVRAAKPLLAALSRKRPDTFIVLTTVTESGRDAAVCLGDVDLHCFFPFDFSPIVRKSLEKLNPSLVIMIETEIWPNFTRAARQLSIPLALVNGRISDRSFPWYRRVTFLLRPVLSAYHAFCMQSDQDADRIRRLGAPPERIYMTGNLKFDLALEKVPSDIGELRDRFALPRSGLIWAAGSTHPGEEKIIIEAFRSLVAGGRRINLVLIPRHPHRVGTVARIFEGLRIPYALLSQAGDRGWKIPRGTALLVDSFGASVPLYAASDVVFVGGSLVGVGGHNLLEPAMARRPVLFGPHTENFRDIAGLILAVGAGRRVSGPEDLLRDVSRLLDDSEEREKMGQRGLAMVRENSGASGRILRVLSPLLDT